MWMALATAWGTTPMVEVEWKGERSRLQVTAPDGFQISPDAPADLTLTWSERSLTLVGSGAQITTGLEVGALRGEALTGVLEVQLCDKASGVCSPGSYTLAGAVSEAKKGLVVLSVEEAHAHASTPTFNTDASAEAETAFAAAAASGDLVILDFSAVWCPPCNLLAAEVLHAPDAETLLEGFQVAVLDVDHRSSWALKDRYEIGSYPTVVVVDAEGNEKARKVGYETRAAFLSFLSETASGTDWSSTDPSALSPDEAAKGLWSLLSGGREEGLESWTEASAESDTRHAHLSRFVLSPNEDDARWLVDHEPASALDWVFSSGDWGETDDARPVLEQAVRAALTQIEGPPAADLLYFAAQLADDDPTLYGAAAATLKASLSGDDFLDRAHYTFLARLMDKAGDPDAGVAFLDEQTRTHPEEPTFLLTAAGILNGRERFEEALNRTETALTRSWGDNKLRVAEAHCKALVGLERADEARGFADKALNEAGPPEEGVEVRTHRYREKLEVFLTP